MITLEEIELDPAREEPANRQQRPLSLTTIRGLRELAYLRTVERLYQDRTNPSPKREG